MNYTETEKIIDIKMLIYYVLKRWKSILLCLIVGCLLGTAFTIVKKQKTLEDFDAGNLHMEQIVQYEHYQQLYNQQLEIEASSVLQHMDPNAAYSAYRVFFVTMPSRQAELIQEKYSMLMADAEVLEGLIEVSGLDCDASAMSELVTVYLSLNTPTTFLNQSGFVPATGKLTIDLLAPSIETGEAMLALLTDKIEAMSKEIEEQLDAFSIDSLAYNYQYGYNEKVQTAQRKMADDLNHYTSELADLEKIMSDEDFEYYAARYGVEQEKDAQKELVAKIKHFIKYSLVFGALFLILAAGFHGVCFLLDDHIKVAHEVQEYGLYTIACLPVEGYKRGFIDKLFDGGTLPVNSKAYLLNALKTMDSSKMVLSGDINDEQTQKVMNWLADQMPELHVLDRMACDEKGLLTAKDSDGAILFVRLWKTTVFDLKRELYVLREMNTPIKGVVVLKG